MIKNFPKSRVCVVDAYPALELGLKKAIAFANKHSLSLSSADGRRLLVSFCIKDIQEAFNKAVSPYSKVLFVSKKTTPQKITNFINNHFEKIINKCPFPYCGVHEALSPDLEIAAQNSLQKTNNKKAEFNNLLRTLKVRNV